jgi:hypothetical protein
MQEHTKKKKSRKLGLLTTTTSPVFPFRMTASKIGSALQLSPHFEKKPTETTPIRSPQLTGNLPYPISSLQLQSRSGSGSDSPHHSNLLIRNSGDGDQLNDTNGTTTPYGSSPPSPNSIFNFRRFSPPNESMMRISPQRTRKVPRIGHFLDRISPKRPSPPSAELLTEVDEADIRKRNGSGDGRLESALPSPRRVKSRSEIKAGIEDQKSKGFLRSGRRSRENRFM